MYVCSYLLVRGSTAQDVMKIKAFFEDEANIEARPFLGWSTGLRQLRSKGLYETLWGRAGRQADPNQADLLCRARYRFLIGFRTRTYKRWLWLLKVVTAISIG